MTVEFIHYILLIIGVFLSFNFANIFKHDTEWFNEQIESLAQKIKSTERSSFFKNMFLVFLFITLTSFFTVFIFKFIFSFSHHSPLVETSRIGYVKFIIYALILFVTLISIVSLLIIAWISLLLSLLGVSLAVSHYTSGQNGKHLGFITFLIGLSGIRELPTFIRIAVLGLLLLVILHALFTSKKFRQEIQGTIITLFVSSTIISLFSFLLGITTFYIWCLFWLHNEKVEWANRVDKKIVSIPDIGITHIEHGVYRMEGWYRRPSVIPQNSIAIPSETIAIAIKHKKCVDILDIHVWAHHVSYKGDTTFLGKYYDHSEGSIGKIIIPVEVSKLKNIRNYNSGKLLLTCGMTPYNHLVTTIKESYITHKIYDIECGQ